MIRSVIFILFSLSNGFCSTIPTKSDPALLVVSYDAFRPEYLHRKVTPNLNKFRSEGTSAEFMLNVFPTKTFVNHFTIATGLYAETHGVLANEVFDLKQGDLKYSYALFHYSDKALPIWTANEKAGKHTGCMMWTGSNFEYHNRTCTFTQPLNISMDWEKRVDVALSWFTDKKTPANLVMLYIEEPDAHGHIYGPDSAVITNMVAKLDNLTRYIQDKLISTGLDNRVNVIHLSDHGMIGVSPPNFIYLDKILANDNCKMYGTSPVLQIVPNDAAKIDGIFAKLSKAAKENGHFKVYNHQNIPSRWHVNNTRRMGPILAVADIGYGFQDLMKSAKYYEKNFNVTITNKTKYGVHGYDNQDSQMHAIFMAKGPLFSKGKTLKSINMIDLYNLMCYILKIECGVNDGSKKLDMYDDLFAAKPVRTTQRAHDSYFLSSLFIAVLAACSPIILLILYLRRRFAVRRYMRARRDLYLNFETSLNDSYS